MELTKLNKNATVDKVLNSEFPVDLLRALSALDQTVHDIEDFANNGASDLAEEDKPDVPPEMLSVLCQWGCITAHEFRKAWAVYNTDTDENTENKDERDDDETVQSNADGEHNRDS